MNSQFLALSLFLMLLSFFIVLSAMSTFDASKARPILNSLTVAFSKEEVTQENIIETIKDPADMRQEGDALDDIDGLFRAHITGVEMAKNRLGTVMHIRIDRTQFDRKIGEVQSITSALRSSDNALFTPPEDSFLPTLISLMQQNESEAYRMDIVANLVAVPARLYSDQPEAMMQEVRAAAGYAEIIEGFGLPKHLVTTGLGAGEDGTVDLFFYAYEPYVPLREAQR